jgi:hypothetical protein
MRQRPGLRQNPWKFRRGFTRGAIGVSIALHGPLYVHEQNVRLNRCACVPRMATVASGRAWRVLRVVLLENLRPFSHRPLSVTKSALVYDSAPFMSCVFRLLPGLRGLRPDESADGRESARASSGRGNQCQSGAIR